MGKELNTAGDVTFSIACVPVLANLKQQ